MRILIVTDKFYPLRDNYCAGGLESVVMNTSKLLSELGNEVAVFGPSDCADTLHEDKVKVVKWSYYSKNYYIENNLNVPRMLGSEILLTLQEEINKNIYDIILCHNMSAGVIKNISNLDIPTVFYVHNGPWYGMGSVATLQAYNYAISKNKLVASVAQWVKDQNNNTVADSTNYVNYVHFHKNDYPIINPEERKGNGIIVARFISRKTSDLGIESFAAANMKCRVIGTPPTNPEKEVEFYKNNVLTTLEKFKDTTTLEENLPNNKVMKALNNSSVLYEGDMLSTMPICPNEAVMMGCTVAKYKSGDGCDELKSLLDNTPIIMSINPSRGTKVKQISEMIKLLDQIPMSERLDTAERAKKLFSKENWIIRFNQMCSDAGVKL